MENPYLGITANALDILFEIRLHDSKEYYESRKQEYRKFVVEPMASLVSAVSETVLAIDDKMQVIPAIGKSISKVRRDTRFSRDKSLYRDSVWFFLRRHGCSWLDAPGFWFEIKQDYFSYGVGLFCARPAMMEQFRKTVLANPAKFEELANQLKSLDGYFADGESYKKEKEGSERLSPAARELFNKKELFIAKKRTDFNILAEKDFAIELRNDFERLADFYKFAMTVYENI